MILFSTSGRIMSTMIITKTKYKNIFPSCFFSVQNKGITYTAVKYTGDKVNRRFPEMKMTYTHNYCTQVDRK